MYMYDCIILDGLGCDVTIAMCNNKTLTPERKEKKLPPPKKKKKKKKIKGLTLRKFVSDVCVCMFCVWEVIGFVD